MADIKWSAFPSTAAAAASGDTLVGLHSGANYQFGITATPTALAICQWDTNKNLSADSFIPGFTSTPMASGTTVLTVNSTEIQEFTGALSQTVTLPVVSTLSLGLQYYIINNGSGTTTVQSSGGNTIQAMAANTSLIMTCTALSGTGTSSWNGTYISDTGGTVNSGTANQMAYYASTGNAVSGLTSANSGLLVTSNAGAPSILAGPGTTGNILQANAAAAPSFSTATYPSTTSVSQLLYSSSANVVAGLTTANNGLLVTGSSGIPSLLAGPGTTGNMLQSNAAAAPSFSTSTYPATNAVSTLLYASSANVMAALATANSASLVTNSSGVPAWSSTMTNGQVIIGSTSATPTAATITAGTGISITNGAASITIASTASGMAWTTLAGTTQTAVVDNGYVSGAAGQTTVTLPTTAALGSTVAVEGLGAGGWILAAGAGQTIKIGSGTTSTAGSLTSAAASDNVYVTCIVANTTWRVRTTNSTGLTIA